MTGVDPETESEVALFNLRQQLWSDHFIWTIDGVRILGATPTGRATCHRLDINDESRVTPFIQSSRRIWIRMGLHPPKTDPRSIVE